MHVDKTRYGNIVNIKQAHYSHGLYKNSSDEIVNVNFCTTTTYM